MAKVKKQKLSECCKAPMIGGVQCENCGSDGKFTTGTAIVKRMDKIISLLKPVESIEMKVLVKDQSERFIDCGDGTIKDTRVLPNGKRLMWQKEGSQERLNYAQAEEFVAELNKEQYPDWYIPSREELESILDLTRSNPAINPLFKCESAYYWTSTPVADYTDDAWIVGFYDGNVGYNYRGSYNYVRPCRQY